MSSTHVLVVDDFAPFRRYICTTLEKRNGLIIREAADGLEAVQQASEWKPQLIFLDIGLPKLNGIAAARQILKRFPDVKIIFVTLESAPDVVQEALNLGALGYVRKTRAETDLLAAVEAVLEGKQFVSCDLIARDRS